MFWSGLIVLNIFLMIFNMLPAFPMDGGRVFRAVLALGMDRLKATRIAARVGMVVAILFAVGMFSMSGQPMILIVALFVIFAGQAELRYLEMQRKYEQEQGLGADPIEAVSLEELDPVYTGYAPPQAVNGATAMSNKISVWTWDQRTGTWVRESYFPAR